MLSVKERGLLLSIIEHCKRIEEKMVGATRKTIEQDADIREIICFNILQIGELAKRLTADFIKKYDKVPWDEIKGMRDVVAHGYGKIDLEDVWVTASRDVKPLKEFCQKILEENQ